MRRAWKRVAERADNRAFSAEEIHAVLVPALEQDCRFEINPLFLRDVRRALDECSSYLFKVDVKPVVELLRPRAASSMDRAILDNLCVLSAEEVRGGDLMLRTMEAVVSDRAVRCLRQVEEHYLREAGRSRADHLRENMNNAIATLRVADVAAAVLNPTPKSRASLKRDGLDDGVDLP